jgi:hypothetical protein
MFLFFLHKKNYEIVKAAHQQRILKKMELKYFV